MLMSPGTTMIALTGASRISVMFSTASADSIMATAKSSPSGLRGQTSALLWYSLAFATPQKRTALPGPPPRSPRGSGRGASRLGG